MTRVRILAWTTNPGMLRAIERVLGAAHHVTVSGSSREALERAAAVAARAGHPRHPDAGAGRLRAHGTPGGAAPGHRRDPHDGERRRPGREARARDPRRRVLLHSEAVRPRGAADPGRPMRRAAAAAGGQPPARPAARARAGRRPHVPAGAAARGGGHRGGRADLLPSHAVVRARRRPVRLRLRSVRAHGAAYRRRGGARRGGSDAHGGRQVGVSRLASPTTTIRSRSPSASVGAWRRSARSAS